MTSEWPGQAEHEAHSRRRRAEVLALPMLPLRETGHLKPPDSFGGHWKPGAAGVSDAGAWAAWPVTDDGGFLITSHAPGSKSSAGVEVPTSLDADFVQPLPGGRVLLAAARTGGSDNAEIWTADGALERTGLLGDAIEHVVTTETGSIWAGYFDEAIGDDGPAGHGLARFTTALEPDWLYPNDSVPPIWDCYAMNVTGETVWTCPYDSFRLLRVSQGQVHDHGPVPAQGAHGLLMQGDRGALIGGYGPDYDLVTPIRLTAGGIEPDGPRCRLVRPDGLEVPRLHWTCRGPGLHLITEWGTWYQASLDDLP